MGLFSKKTKPPKTVVATGKALPHGDSHSTSSFHSGDGQYDLGLKSPLSPNTTRINRTSNPTSTPATPLSPFAPQHTGVNLPRVDLPKPPDPHLDPAAYLRSLGAVRERSKIVTEKAMRNKLSHFDVDISKFPDVVTFVCGIIKRDYDAPFATIPTHGRYQHFCVGGRDRVANLLSTFSDNIDQTEKCRRLVDLFLVSVLLDAGAGTQWSFKSAENGRTYRRSEGLAIASLEMFKMGLFSSDPKNKFQVDKNGLRSLTVESVARAMQSKPGCELAGIEGRTRLLTQLGEALDQQKDFFGDDGRPGNMVDYLLSHPTTQAASMPIVLLPVLWNVLMTGLAPIWPQSRTAMDGVPLGDAWPCSSMPQRRASSPTSPSFSPFPSASTAGGPGGTEPWESILPFHKSTQWLAYSVMQPMQALLRIHFAGTELLTGLPEYRNGGLFIDLGVLTLRADDQERGLQHYADDCRRKGVRPVEVAPMFEPSDDVIVEWRGVTVGFLDKLLVDVNTTLRAEMNGAELTLPQLLEAGSWKGGREIAEFSRPNTKEPPILIDSDGTLF